MTLTINTVDGKSVRTSVSHKDYLGIIGTILDERYLQVESGEIKHLIATQHITIVTVSK